MLDDPSLNSVWLVVSGDGDGHGVSLSNCVGVDDVDGGGWHQFAQLVSVSLSLSHCHHRQVEGCEDAVTFGGEGVSFHGVSSYS